MTNLLSFLIIQSNVAVFARGSKHCALRIVVDCKNVVVLLFLLEDLFARLSNKLIERTRSTGCQDGRPSSVILIDWTPTHTRCRHVLLSQIGGQLGQLVESVEIVESNDAIGAANSHHGVFLIESNTHDVNMLVCVDALQGCSLLGKWLVEDPKSHNSLLAVLPFLHTIF